MSALVPYPSRWISIFVAFAVFPACAVQSKRNENSPPQRVLKPSAVQQAALEKNDRLKKSGKTKGSQNSALASNSNMAPPPAQVVVSAPLTAYQQALSLEKDLKNIDALKEFSNCLNSCSSDSEKADSVNRMVEIVNAKLKNEELESVADSSSFGIARGMANYRLAERAYASRDRDLARSLYTKAISYYPNSDLARLAENQIAFIEGTRNADSQSIGVILPLSGKNAQVGQRALRGIQMGLGLHQPGSKFRLSIIDSEGNPDIARKGVERLIQEDKVIAIIGGLMSKTVNAEASKSDELGVPFLALSQKSGITDVGPNIFRSSMTSQMQIRELVRTAMENRGMKKFALLYPNDAYGVEYANLFWDEVLARGGEITAAQVYNPKESDFRYVAQRLAGTFYIESRLEEYKVRAKELKQQDKKKSVRENSEEDVLPAIVDYDAIFIPDSAKNMGQLAAFLSLAGIRNVALLGTNLWNVNGLSKRAGNFSKDLLFVDNISPKALSESALTIEYKNIFGDEPSVIELQAYDSALILRSFVSDGASTREKVVKELSGLSKFPGITGPLSLNADREIVRPIVSLTLQGSDIVPAKK